ncbi:MULTISPECIES: outer membrane protein assembly factor BamE domain-containing protein [Sphingobacterium]|uniref:Outer membrane protein assembly factor BamE n=1 Tax=Sphingobacterium populi TaxID=1812824 RepID=A0ABW5UGD4_9SPHI|nr:outer membrane protein assembly factor BamE [Sphingobacterium sp. CFCC 11742]
MKNKFRSIVLLLSIFLLSNCAMYQRQLALTMFDVRLGMTREQVVEVLGRPSMVVSAYTTENGDQIEVLEYVRNESNSLTDQVESRPIWTYFINNELFEWGPGENWETDAAFRRAILNRSKDYQQNRPRR